MPTKNHLICQFFSQQIFKFYDQNFVLHKSFHVFKLFSSFTISSNSFFIFPLRKNLFSDFMMISLKL
ncbi:Lysine-specific demethylase JMJ25 [Frankliniella fusca]|uniref:Lysine-specific demethylase JMJ25 n=1 Tax=Frankliniella fusca TaxID=407009 RepID=A0AAE1L7B7_9NEOP|nr:Lysine-specific demethylase JMJ25 [Frankliniella fusca]